MPADDLYWNPMDLDSDESIPYPKQYIDPWDLENYAYIRQHLDSVDLNSDPSSLGEPQETSAFYYIPAKQPEPIDKTNVYYPPEDDVTTETISNSKHEDYYYSPPLPKFSSGKYDTMLTSENTITNYAAIDELTMQNNGPPLVGGRRRKSYTHGTAPRNRYEHERIQEQNTELENIYESGIREDSMQIYETNKPRHPRTNANVIDPRLTRSRTRSHSFSVGDYEYEPYRPSHAARQPIYNGMDDLYVKPDYYELGMSPIYDHIRTHRPKPNNFKLSNYGHLQIDYSCSWNNLNKYIYN